MPKPPAAPITPSSKQRQVLKTLADPRGRAYLVYRPPVWYGSGDCLLELSISGISEKVLGSTFLALQRHGWIEERKTWAETGVSYWFISEAGREALR